MKHDLSNTMKKKNWDVPKSSTLAVNVTGPQVRTKILYKKRQLEHTNNGPHLLSSLENTI